MLKSNIAESTKQKLDDTHLSAAVEASQTIQV